LAKSKKTLEENQAQLKANKAELKQIYAAETEINDALLERGILLEKENALLQKNIASQKRNKKAIDDSAKSIRDNNKFLEDTEDLLGSIADKVGKQHKLYKQGERLLQNQKAGLESIAALTEKTADPKLAKAAEAANNAYKKYQQSVARVADRTAMTGKQQEEANIAIARARAEFDASASALAQMGPDGQFVLDTLNGMANETESFAKNVTASSKEWEAMDALLGSFSGIPALSEMNTLLKTSIRDTLAWKAAVFALGAALGKAAYDYFGAPIKAGMQADRERKQGEIDNIAAVAKLRKDAEFIPAQISQERLEQEISSTNQINELMHEAAYAGQKAAIQFSASMQQGAAQFERAAKTALFGNKLGSVGYGAAQLQLAGISADKIASGMEAASAATGKMPTAKAAADMAIMAERTGQSVDSIASINEMFQRVDGVSESTAMNLNEGLRNMADQAKIGLGGLMKEMAEASKDMLGYQIKSGPALAKQVAYAQSLGVSFGDIAKAGKSMVMNYKDSIKNEMQLSAMLGKNVDLSEVRAKFASGDTEGALKSLQAQGLDPAQMDMFQQEQLSQALGGMDLSSLQKISKNKGADVGGLTQGAAGAGNKDFLARTQSAESALSAKQASISANSAVLDAKLSQKIADAYLASPEYANYKKAQNEAAIEAENLGHKMKDAWLQTDDYKNSLADSMKLDFVAGIKENLMGGLAAIGGGLATSLMDRVIPKSLGGIGGKIKGLFGGGGGAAAGGGGDTGGGDAGGGGADASAASGPIASVAAQIEAAEPVIKKAKPLGKSLAEFGKGIGSFVTSVGKGFGGAIQAIFQGLAQGIQAFGNPAILKGAAIIAGVIVIIGAAIAGASWMMGKALPTLAEGLLKFNDINGMNLLGVGAGLTALGVGMTAMGAGAVASGIGNLVGGLFGGGVEDTIKKLQLFQQADIDAAKVKNNAQAVVNYSLAMAALGGGTAIGGIGALVGSVAGAIAGFFEEKPPMQKMLEFSKYNIDAAKVKNNSEAVAAYAKAMAQLGKGSAIGGLGAAVGAVGGAIADFFGAKPPLAQMADFAKLDMGDTEKLKKNAEAFTAFGNAMASYKGGSGSLGGIIADGVAKFFGVEPPLEKMKQFATADLGDTSKLKANAEAFTLFGNAMASYKGSGQGIGDALAQGVSSFLKVDTPLDKFQQFAAVSGINVEQVKNNAEAFTAFGNAMSTYEGGATEGFWSSLGQGLLSFFGGGSEDVITKFDRFSKLNAGGVVAISDAIGSLNKNLSGFSAATAETVANGFLTVATSTTTNLTAERASAINSFASAMGGLSSNLMSLAMVAPMMNVVSESFVNLASALDRLAQVDVNTINDMPWKSMALFSGAGGRITLASSANNSFNMTQNTAKNIEKLATNTDAMVKLNNTIAKLLKEGFFGGETSSMKLYIDGKDVNSSMKRYKSNTENQDPKKK
jgi:hypothetical protein